MTPKIGDRVVLTYPASFQADWRAVFIITETDRHQGYEGGAWARVRLVSGDGGTLNPHRALAITHFTPAPEEAP